MRRLLALLALLTLATPAAAQSTRAALTSQNNTNITTNGSGAITGAKLNTVIGAGILSYGTLLDPNTWSSVQTYSVAPIFSTLTGYLYGNGSGALTASTTVPSSSLSGLGTNVATALTQNLNGSGAISASTNPAFVNPSFTNFSTGYTAIPTTGGTTTLTSTSTYVQNTTGTLAQTIKLPNETTVPAGTAYIIDNDSTTAIALQDSAGTVLSSAIPYGMAGYIYSTSNATATGNWAGYAFVPNNVSWGTYTFNYFSQATPANSYFTVDATAASAATGLNIKSNAAGSGEALSVLSSGANENLTINAKGTGTITIGGVSSGVVTSNNFASSSAAITGGSIASTPISGSTGSFTTLGASSTVTLSPANANVVLSPTGTGVVTISPATAGTINNVSIGATTASTGKFTTITETNLLVSNAAPTISSGFGTSPSVTANNGTAAFRINVGTGATASSGVIGLPTATTGWNCWVQDFTTPATTFTKVSASTTTTVTVTNYNTTGVATAWAASDILQVSCFAY